MLVLRAIERLGIQCAWLLGTSRPQGRRVQELHQGEAGDRVLHPQLSAWVSTRRKPSFTASSLSILMCVCLCACVRARARARVHTHTHTHTHWLPIAPKDERGKKMPFSRL